MPAFLEKKQIDITGVILKNSKERAREFHLAISSPAF